MMNGLWVSRDKTSRVPDRYIFWRDKPEIDVAGDGEIRFHAAEMVSIVTADMLHRHSNLYLEPGCLVMVGQITLTPLDPRDVKLAHVRELATRRRVAGDGRRELAEEILAIVGDEAS